MASTRLLKSPPRRGIPNLVVLIVLVALIRIPLYMIEARVIQPTTPLSQLEIRFSAPSGFYDHDLELQMHPPHPEANIYFTTDGSPPTPTLGTLYTRPIYLSAEPANMIAIRARAVLPGGEMGPIANASYFMGIETTLPVMSLTVNPDYLWSESNGIFVKPGSGSSWERQVDIYYQDQRNSSGFQVPAGLRVHGASSRGKEKKSLRLFFRNEYGLSRLDYPLFPGGEIDSFKRLVLHGGSQEIPEISSNGTLMRNPIVTDMAALIDGYSPQSQLIVLFINGQLWGVYNMRERVDGHFFTDHFGTQEIDRLVWKVGDPEAADGDLEHWQNLIQFVQTHDLRDPTSYAFVQSQMDVTHFIDYNILQIFIANGDWPQNNQTRFRAREPGGRWHWVFWDTDEGFGLVPNSHIEFDMVSKLFANEEESLEQGTLLLQALMKNPDFNTSFLSRAADLLNTVFLTEEMLPLIDTIADELEPNISYETRRWPSVGNWSDNVEYIREFARRRPEIVRQHFVDVFELSGTAELSFDPPPEAHGTVAVNNQRIGTLPWKGFYFVGIPVRLTAVPQPGYRFAGWEPSSLPQTAEISLLIDGDQRIMPRFEKDDPESPHPNDVRITSFGIDSDLTPGGIQISGDWVELTVMHPDGVDLRGWRLTDNDTKTSMDEGSLIFSQVSALASVLEGTTILLITTESAENTIQFPQDDLNSRDRRMVLYVGNSQLNSETDPWFNLGPNDNLALLAPGVTSAFEDDQGIAFINMNPSVNAINPGTFGILQDGVTGD